MSDQQKRKLGEVALGIRMRNIWFLFTSDKMEAISARHHWIVEMFVLFAVNKDNSGAISRQNDSRCG